MVSGEWNNNVFGVPFRRPHVSASLPAGRILLARLHILTYIGIYWGYIGIMEKKMETTI